MLLVECSFSPESDVDLSGFAALTTLEVIVNHATCLTFPTQLKVLALGGMSGTVIVSNTQDVALEFFESSFQNCPITREVLENLPKMPLEGQGRSQCLCRLVLKSNTWHFKSRKRFLFLDEH